ncbi:hypothetical protein AAVH_16078 [Aphelenchoides avenae]|nr:hypothetical protein AAVH_16078 [Aphelenchus avenae]
MNSLLVILAIVGCATSASIDRRRKDGRDAAAWCKKASKGFSVAFVGLRPFAWNTESLPGSFDKSLPSIAKFEGVMLDQLMSTVNATKSWTTGTYTVDCADADSLPKLEVITDFDELSFTPSDYVDLKNAKVGRCEVLLRPDSSAGHWTFGSLAWQKYCAAGSE